MTIPELEDDLPTTTEPDNDDALPGFATSLTVLALAAAALISRRD
jgi:hypothetical protein